MGWLEDVKKEVDYYKAGWDVPVNIPFSTHTLARLLAIAERAERSAIVHRGIKIGENCGACGKLWRGDKHWGHEETCPYHPDWRPE